MNRHCKIIMASFTLFFLAVTVPANILALSPRPKQAKLISKTVNIGPGSEFVAPANFKRSFEAAIISFKESLASSAKPTNEQAIIVKVLSPTKGDIPKDVLQTLKTHGESYLIDITDNGIIILGSDAIGALHGLTTLEKMVLEGKGKLQQGRILDWPALKVRALHFLLGTRTPGEIKGLIRSARFGHFNTVIIQVDIRVKLASMQHVHFSSELRGTPWSKEEFSDVVRFARENGLDVVPGLSLLTHQNYLLRAAYPHLMFNWVTYDPRKEETYAVVLAMIDEVIELVRPKAFHIGHDEVAGHKPKSLQKLQRMGEKMLPPDLFLKDVLRLHEHLKKGGVQTWMWGDMLLAPGRFPKMNQAYFHGTEGYGALFDKIPKDIVICDWHYEDTRIEFPSALAFAEAGHKVLGSTWRKPETIRRFSTYVANMPFGGEGMIASTWGHLLKKRMDIVQEILDNSAEAFWNAK